MYASAERYGEKFMTAHDFVCKFLGLYTEPNASLESIKLLGGILDTSKDGLISFAEFSAFEGLLCVPDALYRTAFQLFDTTGTGFVTYDEFCAVIKHTVLHKKIPFNFQSDFVKMYFGKDFKRSVTYHEFSQFLHDFHEEHAIQAFSAYNKDGSGFITALDFSDIMLSTKSHLLTSSVQDNLVAVSHLMYCTTSIVSSGQKVSYPFFMAFNSLLTNMELVKRIYLNATQGSRTQEVTKEEFLHSSQMMSQITPMEVEILYHLTELISQSGGHYPRAVHEGNHPQADGHQGRRVARAALHLHCRPGEQLQVHARRYCWRSVPCFTLLLFNYSVVYSLYHVVILDIIFTTISLGAIAGDYIFTKIPFVTVLGRSLTNLYECGVPAHQHFCLAGRIRLFLSSYYCNIYYH
ncbi:hypothetical protein HAZT_HAZT006619 [Hyalella azteca]|uniref:EF-hand domain-containing protein n=1 Tax=Hyalella azteca TaxID=294128 RepID=A0A6A0GZA7_HYAAZ|nr:hypothetical protein HAZT_HAZT006619 [Hyalella azteca]